MVGSSAAAREAPLLRTGAADLLLDRIECGDVLQRLTRDRSGAGCREFVEVAPHVRTPSGLQAIITVPTCGVALRC